MVVRVGDLDTEQVSDGVEEPAGGDVTVTGEAGVAAGVGHELGEEQGSGVGGLGAEGPRSRLLPEEVAGERDAAGGAAEVVLGGEGRQGHRSPCETRRGELALEWVQSGDWTPTVPGTVVASEVTQRVQLAEYPPCTRE